MAFLISLELAKPATHVYHYHSAGWLRECAKWDDLHRRFIVSFMGGGVGQISVPEDHSPETVLEEVQVINDVDLTGNASLGLVIDRSGIGSFWHVVGCDEKSFADDVAVDAEGNAYVTDFRANKIWKVGEDGKLVSIIRSPLFTAKEWYKNLGGLNGIVHHPDGFLLVVHTFGGSLFKIDIGKEGDHEVKLIKVSGGPLTFGDGLELLSPTKLVVAGNNPSGRLVESSDGWDTASVVATFNGPRHRVATAATIKDGKVYLNHLLGFGYPKKKHALVEAVFSA
ncbi:hypothetical protein FNV43_RR23637 [Rhamnella rubrinervis]|uniref:SMP-30/Gluconolactonase/LRE-like region domain-containing protein n=1 Tax=Rhamnella rubrinervis TaxID=2594499 RepID=A0A8K0DZB0_9ROSA|nr:hypothetical protein FNV43_RR23637 [Rhamnella rubrinervis]